MNLQSNRPRLVNWLGYLAIALLLMLPLSLLTVRTGHWQPGLLLYAIACLGSTLLAILAIVLLLLRRFNPWRKDILQRALFALPGTVLLPIANQRRKLSHNSRHIYGYSRSTSVHICAIPARGRRQHARNRSGCNPTATSGLP